MSDLGLSRSMYSEQAAVSPPYQCATCISVLRRVLLVLEVTGWKFFLGFMGVECVICIYQCIKGWSLLCCCMRAARRVFIYHNFSCSVSQGLCNKHFLTVSGGLLHLVVGGTCGFVTLKQLYMLYEVK